MNRKTCAGLVSSITLCLAAHGPQAPSAAQQKARAAVLGAPLAIVQNQGQADPSVLFSASVPGNSMAFLKDGMRLALPGSRRKADLVKMRFVGVQPGVAPAGEERQAVHTGFYTGSDSSKWVENASSYAKVRYPGLYPGTDLVTYGRNDRLEYDWVLQPKADPSRIKVAFEGVESLKVDAKGNLVARTASGAELRQAPPVAYQEIGGQRRPVQARFQVGRDQRVGFRLGAYDRSHELVIDPVLSWSESIDNASEPNNGSPYSVLNNGALAVDSTHNVVAVSWADYDYSGLAVYHMHVALYSSTNGAQIFNTTLGGNSSGEDEVFGVGIDSSDNVYVTGLSGDTSLPLTFGSRTGYTSYVLKVNSSGTFQWSRFFGADSGDSTAGSQPTAMFTDANGNCYITGWTTTTQFPTTAGVFQTAKVDDSATNGFFDGTTYGYDAFVMKVSNAGAVSYATYLGGTDWDQAFAIAVDGSGNAYIGGETYSTDLATAGTYKTTHSADTSNGYLQTDGFVAKINPTATSKTYVTLIGGNQADHVEALELDGSGNIFVGMQTGSTDMGVTAGVVKGTHSSDSGEDDMYIGRLNNAGTALGMGTYLGGSSEDTLDHLHVDGIGDVYVSGTTKSSDFPAVHQMYAYDSTNASAYLLRLKPDGTQILLSTSLTDTSSSAQNPVPPGPAGIIGFALDSGGNAYLAGVKAAYNVDHAELAEFANATPTVSSATSGTTIQEGGNLSFTYAQLATLTSLADSDGDPLTLKISATNGGVNASTLTLPTDSVTWTPGSTQHGNPLAAFTVTANDGHHDSAPATISVKVNAPPTVTDLTGTTVTFEAGSAPTYTQTYTVADAETAAGSLGITANSTNTTLVPNANLAINNSAGSANVVITPVAKTIGSSTISLTVTDGSGGSAATHFTFNVVDTTPPALSNLAVSAQKGNVNLSATSTDYMGVAHVDFYVDGNFKGQQTSPSFKKLGTLSKSTPQVSTTYNESLDTTTIADGDHNLVVKSFDVDGLETDSSPFSFHVDNHPPTSVVASTTGQKGTITLSSSASDSVGVTHVDFYVDGAYHDTQTVKGSNSLYNSGLDSTVLTDGTHTLQTKAFDQVNETDSTTVNFTVDNTVPTGTFDVTQGGSSVNNQTVSGVVLMTTSPSDATTGIARVTFYVDGTYYTTVTSAPYQTNLDTSKLLNGAHTLLAYMVDNAGNISYTNPEHTYITSNNADTIPPTGNTTISGTSGTITFNTTASDASGIARVTYYIDGHYFKSVTSAPYSATIDSTTLSNGTHYVLTYGVDNAGNIGYFDHGKAFTVNN